MVIIGRKTLTGMTAAVVMIATACGSFEAQSIVVDLRILGMSVDPPEVVSDFDPENPFDIELEDVQACALIADPAESRELYFNMVACAPERDGRCDNPENSFVDMGFGTVEDPEEADESVQVCATLPANANLKAVIEEAIEADSFSGFGGVAVQIEFYVRPSDETIDEAQFATKRMLYAPRIPEEREANKNPTLENMLFAVIDEDTEPKEVEPTDTLLLGRCNEVAPISVAPGATVKFLPLEPDGARQDYLVPTLDGGARTFTEYMTYAWYATHGDWTREETGGRRSFVGDAPPLDTLWHAPKDEDVIGEGLDVRMWFVLRDERGGAAWYEGCLHVAKATGS